MSEDEIINRLKERIKIDRSMRLNVESDFDRFCEEECQAIEELIDLYNKEKEKNEKIINKYNELLDAYIQELIDHKKEVEEGLKELDFLKTLISKELLEEE